MPSNKSQINKLNDVDGFIIGIDNFSWYVPLTVKIDELEELVSEIKKKEKKIFISLNKLMYNEDIPLLKEYLLVIDKLNVDGIMFDDLAIYRLSKSMALKTPLIWFSAHLFTNYRTANYWSKKGVKGGVLSLEMPIDHIETISDNTDMKLMMYGYGYLPMFVSSRSLISSYFKYLGKEKEQKLYHMYEESHDSSYPTYEMNEGSIILSSEILNIINELPLLDKRVEYIILSGLNIPDDSFINICGYYIEALNNINNKSKLNELNNLVTAHSPARTDKGFLYKETIYRVKNDGER